MRKVTLILVSATFILFSAVSGCGKKDDPQSGSKSSINNSIAITPAQKMAKSYISEMQQMASALESVTDAKSAEKAATEIRKINVRMEALSDKYEDSDNQFGMATVMMSHQQEFMAIQTRVSGAMMKLSTDPALMKTMTDAMSETPKLK